MAHGSEYFEKSIDRNENKEEHQPRKILQVECKRYRVSRVVARDVLDRVESKCFWRGIKHRINYFVTERII